MASSKQLDKPKMASWLESFLDNTPKPAHPTKETLTQIGENALHAKLMDVEEYNMEVSPRLRKRLPERLEFSEIAAILLHVLSFRSIATSKQADSGTLGVYVPGDNIMWQKGSKFKNPEGIYSTNEKLLQYMMRQLTADIRQKEIEEAIGIINTYAPEVSATTDPHLFPVNNGIYNQKTGVLEPFSEDYVFLTKINVNYVPNAQNPMIQEPDGTHWDVESWLNDLSVTPEVNELLWQVIAASLQPNRGMNKSIWFYSESGNNGKGTVGQLIKNLLGKGNYSSLSVIDFNHEFKKQDLLGVAANIADENDVDKYIDSVKDYKASITGDDVIINRKHKDPVRVQFRGLNIQMMNGLPKTKDKTGSFYRRLIIVPFIKSFTNNGEKNYIKSDYIARKEVLEYVLYKALSLEFDEFSVPQASAYLLDQYREKNNPVLDFWNELREEFKWDLIPKQFLYDLYQKWFERSNPSGKLIGQRTFFDQLSPIIDADGEWENRIGADKTNIRTGTSMDNDEPLITEYGLDKPYRNGAPSPWVNSSYNGTNPQTIRDFTRKTKYRGILRN
ncbi:DNA primase family protein [Evansella clarkii]|uniref:DNA primase family protein n=1 Tax=Evansella clarkii TaxID=79879 RepID=UPI000996006E|nr:phage/plasmid primase, P4 family [Evansella clarkii]